MPIQISRQALQSAAEELDAQQGWNIAAELLKVLEDPELTVEEKGLWSKLLRVTEAAKWAFALVLAVSAANTFLDKLNVDGKSDEEVVDMLRGHLYQDYVSKVPRNAEKARAIAKAVARALARQLAGRSEKEDE